MQSDDNQEHGQASSPEEPVTSTEPMTSTDLDSTTMDDGRPALSGQASLLSRREWLRTTGRAAAIISSGAIGASVAGCFGGGSGPGGGVGSGNGPITGKLAPNVVPIPSDGSVQVVQQTDTSITLSGSVPTLASGDVIVCGIGQGFLLFVQSISYNNGSVTLQTQQATLEDLFEEANVNFQKTLTNADIASVTGPGLALSRSRDQTTLSININLGGGASLVGSVSFGINFDFTVEIARFRLQLFRCVPTATVGASASLSVPIAGASLTITQPLGTITFTPITIPVPVGFIVVPIVLVPVLELNAVVTGTIAAQVTISLSASVTAQAGTQYDSTGGFQLISNLNWTAGANFCPTASLSVTVSPVQTTFNIRLYGVAGPYLTGDIPSFTATATITPGPSIQGNFSASGNIKISAGAKVVVLSKTLANADFPVALQASKTLLNVNLTPPDHFDITPANPTLGVGQMLQLTATAKDKNNNTITPNPSCGSPYDLNWTQIGGAVTIDTTGKVTAVTPGTSIVTVVDRNSGAKGTTNVMVPTGAVGQTP